MKENNNIPKDILPKYALDIGQEVNEKGEETIINKVESKEIIVGHDPYPIWSEKEKTEKLFVKLKGCDSLDKPKARANSHTYTGVMLEKDKADYGKLISVGYGFFDFDTAGVTKIIDKIILDLGLKCKKLHTDRGAHYTFKTNRDKFGQGSHKYNWLGLEFDWLGVGTEEPKKTIYEIHRLLGKQRPEEYLGGATCDEELDFAPNWLYVASEKRQIDMTKDMEGSRNDMFHGEFMIEAKRNGFTYSAYVDMAKIVNDYVLPEGLSEEELEVATREDEWEKIVVTGDKDKDKLLDMARDVIDIWSCLYRSMGDIIMFFDKEKNRYNSKEVRLQCYLQEKYYEENITTRRIKEVLDNVRIQLENYNNMYNFERNKEFICCKNNLVSCYKDMTLEPTRSIVTDIYYNFSIMEDEEFTAFRGRIVQFLDEISVGQADVRTAILEMVRLYVSTK